jgi:tol-pal system protein YbgF
VRPRRPQARFTRVWLALPLVGLLAAGCASVTREDVSSIQAQLSDIQNQIDQFQQQAPSKTEVQSLESQVAEELESLLHSEADMQVRLQELRTQIEQLRAQLEDTNYRLSQVSQQIAATNQELQAFRALQRRNLGTEGGAGGPESSSETGGDVQTLDPQKLYQAAYQDYTQSNFALAIDGFREYLRNFPETDLSDNATYWIGESYYRQGMYRRAIGQFEAVLQRYPRSDKVPSALLKKGYAHLELGEREPGIAELRRVIRDYPNSDEANLARERLRDLGANR